MARPHSFIVAPTTSWPASSTSDAATEESTPPDMATRTRIFVTRSARSRATASATARRRRGHVLVGRGPAQGEAQRGRRLVLVHAHGQEGGAPF